MRGTYFGREETQEEAILVLPRRRLKRSELLLSRSPKMRSNVLFPAEKNAEKEHVAAEKKVPEEVGIKDEEVRVM